MSIIIDHYRFQITALLYLIWPSHDRHHCRDYKVWHPEALPSSRRSSLSSEWLISSGRDKRFINMATTCAHFNMPAVCTDKAWRSVCVIFRSVCKLMVCSAQMQETYLSFGVEFGGKTPGWLSDDSESKVHEEGWEGFRCQAEQESVWLLIDEGYSGQELTLNPSQTYPTIVIFDWNALCHVFLTLYHPSVVQATWTFLLLI